MILNWFSRLVGIVCQLMREEKNSQKEIWVINMVTTLWGVVTIMNKRGTKNTNYTYNTYFQWPYLEYINQLTYIYVTVITSIMFCFMLPNICTVNCSALILYVPIRFTQQINAEEFWSLRKKIPQMYLYSVTLYKTCHHNFQFSA
jgi:hypothetical protein